MKEKLYTTDVEIILINKDKILFSILEDSGIRLRMDINEVKRFLHINRKSCKNERITMMNSDGDAFYYYDFDSLYINPTNILHIGMKHIG